MKYTTKTKSALSVFLRKLVDVIQLERKVVLSDLSNLQSFLNDRENKSEIIGGCKIVIGTEYSQNDGSHIKLRETLNLNRQGFTLYHFSEEGYYGEYYSNNEFRIGETEEEEYIPQCLNDAFEEIKRILTELSGFVEIETNRFGVKEVRKKKTGST